MKRLGIIIVVIIVGIGIVFTMRSVVPQPNTLPQAVIPTLPASIKDATYVLEHQTVTLANGAAETTTEGATASTKYFGNEVEGDFNNDGTADTAFVLTQDSGGSGTFYYLVAALKTGSGYQGTNGILLGDRIAPQTTDYLNGLIVVNYADRKPSEPMTAVPTIGVSRYFRIDGSALIEVPKT